MNAVVWGAILIVVIFLAGILPAVLRNTNDDDDCGVGK
jgi:hypothetical protein